MAFSCASLSVSCASPNPAVGAILVSNNSILSSGRTQAYGHEHAEVMAIQSALKKQKDLTNTTLYVTLEPCCVIKNTHPCTDLIIKEKIPRVIIAVLDPSKEMQGKSIIILKKSFVSVKVLDSSKFLTDIIYTLGGFFERILFNKPRIWYKWAQTKNGFLAPQNGTSGNISSADSRSFNFFLRGLFGVVSASPGTVVIDSPKLNVRDWTSVHKVLIKHPNLFESSLFHYYKAAYEDYLLTNKITKPIKRIYLLPRTSVNFSLESLHKLIESRTTDSSCSTSYIISTQEHEKVCKQRLLNYNKISSLNKIDEIQNIFFQNGYNNVYFESGPTFFNTLWKKQEVDYVICFITETTHFMNNQKDNLGRRHHLSTSLAILKKPFKRGTIIDDFIILDTLTIGSEELLVLVHQRKLEQLQNIIKNNYV